MGISPDGKLGRGRGGGERTSVAFVDTRHERAVPSSSRCTARTPSTRCSRPTASWCSSAPRTAARVDVIDVAQRKPGRRRCRSGARPRGIGFSPDGKRAYVAAENSNELYVIDAAKFARARQKIKAGLRANGIAVHPDGKRVYVSNGGDARCR